MAVEGYQGYVAPIQGGTSYAQALQERVQFIQDQQRENIASIIANQQKKNEFRLKQLESLYRFQTNGWGEEPIKAFGEMRDRVSQKMKSGGYADIEDFYSDLSKLSDTHAFFSNHYETVKPVLDETAKLMQNPGMYPDKTRRPIDTVETYGKKYEDYLNLGMTGIQVGDDLSLTYIDQDGNTVSVYDNPIASNTSYFGPLLGFNFVQPVDVAEQFEGVTDKLMNSTMSVAQARAQVEGAVRTKIANDESLLVSAQMLFEQKGLQEVEDINPVNTYVEEVMRNLAFAKEPVRTTSTARSTGGGGDKKETNKIYNVVAKQTEVATDALNVGLAAMGEIGPGADKEIAYEYSLPAGVIDPINISDLLSEEELFGITDENAKATVKTIALSETGITIRDVLVGNKSVGDKFIPYSNSISDEILQSLQEAYDYSSESWKNGDVYRLINQRNAGVPPANTDMGAPAEKPQFN